MEAPVPLPRVSDEILRVCPEACEIDAKSGPVIHRKRAPAGLRGADV